MHATRALQVRRFEVFTAAAPCLSSELIEAWLDGGLIEPGFRKSKVNSVYMTLRRWVAIGAARRNAATTCFSPAITAETFSQLLDQMAAERVEKISRSAVQKRRAGRAAWLPIGSSDLAPWLRGLV